MGPLAPVINVSQVKKHQAEKFWSTAESHILPSRWGTQIMFCHPISKTEKSADGEETDKTFFFLKTYTVFNLDQVEGKFLGHLRVGNAPITAADLHSRHEEAEEHLRPQGIHPRTGEHQWSRRRRHFTAKNSRTFRC